MEEKIKELIRLNLDLFNKVKNSNNLKDDLGADSLDIVELIMILQDEFLIKISDEDAEKLETVQDFINIVTKLKG